MASSEAPKRRRTPVHPGAVLREDVLPGLGVGVMPAARALGISRQQLHRILAETVPITPEMALRLGKFCGNSPQFWLAMQAEHDLWHAERRLRDELAKIPTSRAVESSASGRAAADQRKRSP